MDYDIIFISGELYFDHPLCGLAIIKRLLEKNGYKVGIIEMPTKPEDVKRLGTPKLFFGVTSGSIDSMVRNYTPLKKLRKDDKNLDYNETVPNRAVITYCNWVKQHMKGVPIVIGGTEASLRRFVHYDYWDNRLRRPILFESRADILAYGMAEKQILEISRRIKNKEPLEGIQGTCIGSKSVPEGFSELPSLNQVTESKEEFCRMQMMLDNCKNLAQKIDDRYILQYKSPVYQSEDLDEYYGQPFKRKMPKHLRSFEFSVVTHRGCIGECSFCALSLMAGNRIISRSEKSIIEELKAITKLPFFKGNIDDLGGPSANMYGMDCNKCDGHCIECPRLDRSNHRLIELLKKARKIPGIRKINIRSGIRYDLASKKYIEEIGKHHIFETLRIAPEHVNKNMLRLMNKDRGVLQRFEEDFQKVSGKGLSFYFLAAHPGSSMKEARELAGALRKMKNVNFQVFTPTPMTVSTCMYYTGIDPRTMKKVYVPYSYKEKKEQKRLLM